MQDAFTKLWASRNIANEAGEIRDSGRWVYRVANNAMIDLARLRRSRPTTTLLEEAVTGTTSDHSSVPVASVPSPDLGSYENEDGHARDAWEDETERRRLALESALERLNPAHKSLLLDFYVKGKDYAELARETGYSRAALGTTLLRARKNVLKFAEEYLANKGHPDLRVMD